jgi:cysteine peptidase C11 family protein
VTRRYYLRKGTSMQADSVQSLGETNCGDPAVLEDFIKWGIANYPAEHYAVVLWNHGAGWDDSNVYEGAAFGDAAPPVVRKGAKVRNAGSPARGAVPVRQVHAALARARRVLFRTSILQAIKSAGGQARAIAFDDQAQDFLDNVEMKAVLGRVRKSLKRKIDILGMDACLMSMAEVAYQVRGAADISVGSQESEPGNGWPYDRILKALAAKPDMAPRELASVIVRQYLASYGKNEGVTQAAVDLAALPDLAKAIDALAKLLKGALADAAMKNALIQARLKTQEYSPPYDDYCDLIDLCDLISAAVARPDIAKACDAVKQAAAKAVIDSGAQGDTVAHSHGLSIYFPKRRRSMLYGRLDFAKATKWDEFIDEYLAQSVRR